MFTSFRLQISSWTSCIIPTVPVFFILHLVFQINKFRFVRDIQQINSVLKILKVNKIAERGKSAQLPNLIWVQVYGMQSRN